MSSCSVVIAGIRVGIIIMHNIMISLILAENKSLKFINYVPLNVILFILRKQVFAYLIINY